MPLVFVESFGEFCERQDCGYIFVGERYVFRNGAQSDEKVHSEPPTDPDELIALRYEYAVAKLKEVKAKYSHDRAAISEQAYYHSINAGPMPPDGWKQHLQRLAKQIERLQALQQSLERQMPRPQADQQHADYRTEQKVTARNAVAALQQLPVY